MPIAITLQPKQSEAFDLSQKTPVLFFGGARGGGKSYLVRAKEIYMRLKYPKTKGLILRKTHPELLSNHIRKIQEEYPQVESWYSRGEKAIHYPNGSITEFSYLQNADDVYTYQGREYENISVDEAQQHDFAVIKHLRSSLRTTNRDITPTMLLTGNPGGIGHQQLKRIFINRDFIDGERPEDFAFVQSFVQDNKALMEADPEYVRRLQDLPEHLRKAYLFGDWNISAGQMFPHLRIATHVIEPFELPVGTRYFAGLDWGYEHPFAFVLMCVTPSGEMFVKSYLTGRQQTVKDITQKILNMVSGCTPLRIYAGSDLWSKRSGEYTIFHEFLDAGLNAKNKISLVRAYYDKNSRIHGVNTIRKHTVGDKPIVRFFKNVLPVFNNIADMQIDPDNPEDVLKVNADENGFGGDDLYDACFVSGTKITTLRGSVDIENVKVGDKVLTRRGFKEVEIARSSGIKDVYKINFNDGSSIIATADHPFYSISARDFRRLDTLRYGDIMYTWNQLSLHTKALSLGATLIQSTQHTADTTRHLCTISAKVLTYYIGKYGRTLSGIFHKAITYIIKTGTLTTTALKTWSVYQRKSMGKGTQESQKKECTQSAGRRKKLLSGTNQSREEHGTKVITVNHSHLLSIKNLNVKFAGLLSYLKKQVVGSVQTIINRYSEDSRVLTTLKSIVRDVGQNLSPTNFTRCAIALGLAQKRVIGREYIGKKEVFNLQVKDCPEYFANGVLVHNCRYSLYSFVTIPNAQPADLPKNSGERILREIFDSSDARDKYREFL